MEEIENENENSHKNKLNPIPMKLQSSQADPLFSSIVTFHILILLYFPRIILPGVIFSPFLATAAFTLLLALLRFGSTRTNENKENTDSNCTAEAADHHQTTTIPYSVRVHECKDSNFPPDACFEDSFVEWNVSAPLEVIYEAYEGEEEEEEGENIEDPMEKKHPFLIERYASLSLYYPETDSDASSEGGDFLAVGDWGSPESVCFRWEDEDREGLIEIALDNDNNNNNNHEREKLDFGEEENNLIEIDISPARDGEKSRFSS